MASKNKSADRPAFRKNGNAVTAKRKLHSDVVTSNRKDQAEVATALKKGRPEVIGQMRQIILSIGMPSSLESTAGSPFSDTAPTASSSGKATLRMTSSTSGEAR